MSEIWSTKEKALFQIDDSLAILPGSLSSLAKIRVYAPNLGGKGTVEHENTSPKFLKNKKER